MKKPDSDFLDSLDEVFDNCAAGNDVPSHLIVSVELAFRMVEEDLGRKLTDGEKETLLKEWEKNT